MASPFIVTSRRKVHLRACPHAYRIAFPLSWLPEIGTPKDHACVTCLSGLLPTAVPSEEGPNG